MNKIWSHPYGLAAIILIVLPIAAPAEITVTLDGGFSGITSNSVIDIDHDSASVWLGTGSGPAVSRDNGSTWTTYGKNPLPAAEVSALAANNRGVWVATSHSQVSQGQSYPFGNGISLTRDGGQTWSNFSPEQSSYFGKLAYDVALYDSVAYAACFYGGLIRSTDWGVTWANIFPSQIDSINSDSIDYYSNLYSSFSNRMFAVKTDTTCFPDTFSVWSGSANGIFRFIYSTSFADDFSHGLTKWKKFGVPFPVVRDTLTIGDSLRTGIFDNMGDTTGNSGIVSKKVFAGPNGFTLETDIYLQVIDTLGCWDEAGIGMPKIANPGWSGARSDTAFDAYGLYFSLSFVGEACPDPRVPPEARHHAWFNARYLDQNDSIQVFDPYSDSSADAFINNWKTLRINVDDTGAVRFEIISGIDTIPIWTPTTRLNSSMMSGRNIVLGFRSSPDIDISAGKAYHDAIRAYQTGSRIYPTYPDSVAHYFYSLTDTSQVDSLKLPGNHVVALGINKTGSLKSIWAACRPVSTGEQLRVAFSTNDGQTWHAANISDPSGAKEVEGWDFSFDSATVYVATSFGLFNSSGDYSDWTRDTSFVDSLGETFYRADAPFYSTDVAYGTLWAGGTDGVVKALPNNNWRVIRSDLRPDEHYAYPSPFSPVLSTRRGTTIHFKPANDTRVNVKIYDFNLELVKTVVTGLARRGGVESDDIVWDGTNDKGKYVANGVYFYRIELDSGKDLWGKVAVIK
jgi:hypothetical protein